MMRNNNSNQNAVDRLAKLPMVRSACAVLSILYVDTKCSHPSLKSVCEVVEGGVTAVSSVAYDSVSPVIIKLEPQISIMNNVACKGLDWLETAFPLLQKPTEQIAASAKNKMLEVKDLVSIAGNGTKDFVQHTITWVVERMQQVTDPTRKMADDGVKQSLVKRAISVASLRLDSALSMSEALMDQVLPPTIEDLEEEAKTVEGFEAAAVRTSYPVRLVSLTAKLYTRTYHKVGTKMHCTGLQVMEGLSRSPGLVQHLQTSWLTLTWGLHDLPQHLQYQVVCALLIVSQMYNSSCPISQQNLPDRVRGSLNTALDYLAHSTHFNSVAPVRPQPVSNGRMRPIKTSVFVNGHNDKVYER